MNTLNISLPYGYVSSLVLLNWYDVLFGVEEGFLLPTAVTEHAVLELENNENPKQAVIDLACLGEGESIHPHINELEVPSDNNKKEVQEKFLFVLLNWVYEHKEMYSDRLEAVEIIYADFNYPQTISNFIRYMPSDQPLLGTQEENLERLYDNWKSFPASQKKNTQFSYLHYRANSVANAYRVDTAYDADKIKTKRMKIKKVIQGG